MGAAYHLTREALLFVRTPCLEAARGHDLRGPGEAEQVAHALEQETGFVEPALPLPRLVVGHHEQLDDLQGVVLDALAEGEAR